MKTIPISDGIELVIVDDGGMCIKDIFGGKSIAILPEELDAIAVAVEQAKLYRVAKKFTDVVKNSSLKICKCSTYQLEKCGCVCATREE